MRVGEVRVSVGAGAETGEIGYYGVRWACGESGLWIGRELEGAGGWEEPGVREGLGLGWALG